MNGINMQPIDWTIVAVVVAFFIGMAWFTKRYTRSVADFMAANRCAGRYVLAVAYGISSLGAITVIAEFQKYYKAGFTAIWGSFIFFGVAVIIAVTGWVVYRYRETRAFTLGQFFEVRYSKPFRIFAGILGFGAGVVNFGIFPAVGSRFFIYFCGLPPEITILGAPVSTFVLIMLILLLVSLFFTFVGGQIAVIVTDFLQGVFCNIVFIIILVLLFLKFDWSILLEGLQMAPADQSRINPFSTSGIKDFNIWFFLIIAFTMFYGVISWQGQQGYFCSSKSPHEQKMAMILANWRFVALTLLLLLLSISAYVVMHHPGAEFQAVADKVNNTLAGVESNQVREQIRVPLVLVNILPRGIVGMFCAVMLAAFISTHDTYLHTWGSIFIQDVVVPFRKTPLTPQQHMALLRVSIIGVAVFVFTWSYLFRQTQDILMYFQITGAIYTGGIGSAIVGGLYWKRGTTAAAWSAMITGSILATTGVILKQIHNAAPFDNEVLAYVADQTGAVLGFCASIISILVYVIVSLCTSREKYDLDRMLHRGQYALKNDPAAPASPDDQPQRGWKALVGGREFTKRDKAVRLSITVWGIGWFLVFIAGLIINKISPISDTVWAGFWHVYVWISLIIGAVITIWFAIGGMMDLRYMFKTLATAKRNDLDTGMVQDHRNLADLEEPNGE